MDVIVRKVIPVFTGVEVAALGIVGAALDVADVVVAAATKKQPGTGRKKRIIRK